MVSELQRDEVPDVVNVGATVVFDAFLLGSLLAILWAIVRDWK